VRVNLRCNANIVALRTQAGCDVIDDDAGPDPPAVPNIYGYPAADSAIAGLNYFTVNYFGFSDDSIRSLTIDGSGVGLESLKSKTHCG
jgi:hypothetical protein